MYHTMDVESKDYGKWAESTVGKFIEVDWDDTFYLALVRAYNDEKKRHKVLYEQDVAKEYLRLMPNFVAISKDGKDTFPWRYTRKKFIYYKGKVKVSSEEIEANAGEVPEQYKHVLLRGQSSGSLGSNVSLKDDQEWELGSSHGKKDEEEERMAKREQKRTKTTDSNIPTRKKDMDPKLDKMHDSKKENESKKRTVLNDKLDHPTLKRKKFSDDLMLSKKEKQLKQRSKISSDDLGPPKILKRKTCSGDVLLSKEEKALQRKSSSDDLGSKKLKRNSVSDDILLSKQEKALKRKSDLSDETRMLSNNPWEGVSPSLASSSSSSSSSSMTTNQGKLPSMEREMVQADKNLEEITPRSEEIVNEDARKDSGKKRVRFAEGRNTRHYYVTETDPEEEAETQREVQKALDSSLQTKRNNATNFLMKSFKSVFPKDSAEKMFRFVSELERGIFEYCRFNHSTNYTQKVRQMETNLKQNKSILESLRQGKITPITVCAMDLDTLRGRDPSELERQKKEFVQAVKIGGSSSDDADHQLAQSREKQPSQHNQEGEKQQEPSTAYTDKSVDELLKTALMNVEIPIDQSGPKPNVKEGEGCEWTGTLADQHVRLLLIKSTEDDEDLHIGRHVFSLLGPKLRGTGRVPHDQAVKFIRMTLRSSMSKDVVFASVFPSQNDHAENLNKYFAEMKRKFRVGYVKIPEIGLQIYLFAPGQVEKYNLPTAIPLHPFRGQGVASLIYQANKISQEGTPPLPDPLEMQRQVEIPSSAASFASSASSSSVPTTSFYTQPPQVTTPIPLGPQGKADLMQILAKLKKTKGIATSAPESATSIPKPNPPTPYTRNVIAELVKYLVSYNIKDVNAARAHLDADAYKYPFLFDNHPQHGQFLALLGKQ